MVFSVCFIFLGKKSSLYWAFFVDNFLYYTLNILLSAFIRKKLRCAFTIMQMCGSHFEELETVLCDLAFVEMKCRQGQITQLIEDFSIRGKGCLFCNDHN